MLGYTLFERNCEADDTTYVLGGIVRVSQSFTPSTAHNLYTFCFKIINAATCGDATIRIYDVDADHKPTGSALATMVIANASISAVAYEYTYTVTTALKMDTSEKAAVLSSAATGLGARYQGTGSYSGYAFTSPNSGTTWNAIANASFLFQEWGQKLPLYGTYKIPLLPAGAGTYTELGNPKNTANWQNVANSLDAPDDSGVVVYALGDMVVNGDPTNSFGWSIDDPFLSGATTVAGYLTGTSVLWKTGVAGITGTGTDFTSELAKGYVVRTPNLSDWYLGQNRRVSQVTSVDSNTGATFTYKPSESQAFLSTNYRVGNSWFFTPKDSDAADAGWINSIKLTGQQDNRYNLTIPMTFMAGVWTEVGGGKLITAAGGAALSAYPDTTFATGNYYGTGHTTKKNTGMAHGVTTVDSDNQLTNWDTFINTKEGLDGKSKYAGTWVEDDLSSETTATQWCAAEKKDSYTVKTTINSGDIHRITVKYRVFVLHFNRTDGYSVTATAKPFCYLGGVFAYGTERTITSTDEDAMWTDGTKWYKPTVWEFDDVLAKPGGGVFTREDLEDIEFGITLGNISDIRATVGIYCSQLVPIAWVSNLPAYIVMGTRIGLDDRGFIVRGNWDEWNSPVGLDGVNAMGWGIHYASWLSRFVAKPLKLMFQTVRKVYRRSTILRLRRR